MCSGRDDAALPALGCPIRESAGQRLFSASPRLIAAVHALHRLLVPRHPPSALTILTVISTSSRARAGDTRSLAIAVQFSRSVERTRAGTPRAGPSKLDSMPAHEAPGPGPVDVLETRDRNERPALAPGFGAP